MTETFFLKLVNMGITASWTVLAVLAVRLLIRRAPKWIHCLLWIPVALRLLLPFTLQSTFSLVPSSETVPSEILTAATPTIQTGISSLNAMVNPIISERLAPRLGDSINPTQVMTAVAVTIWGIGAAALLLYAAISALRLAIRVRESVALTEDVRLCDRISVPFIFGVFKPQIYLPSSLEEADRVYVLAHERAHLRRLDYLWKPIGFVLLSLYWFHPLLWVAYLLLCRDMEGACDEKVIASMGGEAKKPYAEALLRSSVSGNRISACPLAFGECNVKGRIRAVLHYKKPSFWILIAALLLCTAVGLCFLTDPYSGTEPSDSWIAEIYWEEEILRVTELSGNNRLYHRTPLSEVDRAVEIGDLIVSFHEEGDVYTVYAEKEDSPLGDRLPTTLIVSGGEETWFCFEPIVYDIVRGELPHSLEGCINSKFLYLSSVQYLPLYRIDSMTELQSFSERFSQNGEDALSFAAVTSHFSAGSFAQRTLFAIAIDEGTPDTYALSSVWCEQSCLTFEVACSAKEGDDPIWMLVWVDRRLLEECNTFTAYLTSAS